MSNYASSSFSALKVTWQPHILKTCCTHCKMVDISKDIQWRKLCQIWHCSLMHLCGFLVLVNSSIPCDHRVMIMWIMMNWTTDFLAGASVRWGPTLDAIYGDLPRLSSLVYLILNGLDVNEFWIPVIKVRTNHICQPWKKRIPRNST